MVKLAAIREELLKAAAEIREAFGKSSASGRNCATGLRIGDDFLEWTTLREGRTGIETVASNHVLIPPPSTAAEEVAARADQVRQSCAEVKGAVSVGIAPSRMLMRIAELPTSDPVEMEKMIQLQIDGASPFPEDRMYVSHEVLARSEAGVRVLIAAVQKDLVESIGHDLRQVGLNVQRIDAEAMAWWNLLSAHSQVPEDGRYLCLVLEPWGGVWIAVQKRCPLSFRAVSPCGDMPFDEYASEVAEDAAALLLALDAEHGGEPLAGVEVWCRGVETEPLSAALASALQHDPVLRSLDSLPPVSEGLARRLIGTALSPSLTRVAGKDAVLDLVPVSWRSAIIARRLRRRLLAATVGIFGLWLLGMAGFFGLYHFQHYRLGRLEARMAALQTPADEVRLMQNQARSFEQYLDRKNSALECLREISQGMPNGMFITSFQFKKGKSVSIRGEALAVNSIYDYKQVLDKSPLFAVVEMGSIQPGKRKDTTVQTFQMTCRIKERP